MDDLDPRVAEALWEHAVIGLAEVGRDGSWQRVNPALCRMLEYTQSELRGGKFQDVTDPRDVGADVSMIRALIDRELDQYVMTKRYITKTGKVVWINLKVVPIFRDDGEVDFFLSQIVRAKEANLSADGVKVEEVVTVAHRSETLFRFLRRNWKWVVTALAAVGGAIGVEIVTIRVTSNRVDRMERTLEKVVEKMVDDE